MNLLTKELLKEHRTLLLFISFVAVVRLLLAPHVGLGVDEAHYVLYALNLDLSYFDHPPLVGWVQYLFTSIFGTGEFGARVSAILIGFFTSIFVYKLIYDINKNSTEAFVALLALHASFLFNALFIMLMPDTLLFLLILPIIFTLIRVEKDKESTSSWILLGILLGLAGLAKYTAVLFIVPILLYVIIKKRFDLFVTPKLLLSIAIALLIISPVIIWNIQNDWSSFAYQSSHVVGESHIKLSRIFKSLGAQFGAYNPLLVPLAFYGLYRALRSKNNQLFLSALFGLVLISFFTYASLYKTALPHWSALFYMIFIPLGSYYMLDISKKYLRVAIVFGLVIGVLAYAELGLKFIPQPDHKSIHLDIYGWDSIMKRVNSHLKNTQKEAIAVPHWTLASRALYYNRDFNSTLYLLDDREDQFDIWEDNKSIGKDMLVINTTRFDRDIKEYMKCDTFRDIDKFDIKLHGNIINTILVTECKNYKGIKK